MRIVLLRMYLLAVVVLSVGKGRAATDEALAKMDGDLIGRFHFAGVGRIDTDPAGVTLKRLGALPETAALREELLQKLATTPFRVLKSKLAPGNTSDFSPLLRPLLDDLLHEESYAEFRGPNDAVPEFMLAVHLNSNRAILWESSLSSILVKWTGIPVIQIKGDGFTGWELKKHVDPNLIRCLRVGDWLLFGWGQNELRLQSNFVQRIKTTKRPVEAFKEEWLDVTMDWPVFMSHHPFTPPAPLPAQLPKMHLTALTKQDFIRPKLVMQFAEPLGLKLEDWKIPTNTIHGPIASFAVARGIAPWLSQLEFVKKSQLPSVPNQVTSWSVSGVPFETFLALPVPHASNYLAQAATQMAPAINEALAKSRIIGHAVWTNNEVVLERMPIARPYLQPVQDASGDFLLSGLVPSFPRTNMTPMPTALLSEINAKPDLVYYGWEINQERIPQWVNLNQIYLMVASKLFAPPSSAGIKWLVAAKSKLGNCATEVTLSAPDELTLVRNAPIGLTAMEMTLLEYWIDSPEFPLRATYMPPMQAPVSKQQSKK